MNKKKLENLFDELFPLNRSISGDGLRKSLDAIGRYIPLVRIEYPTGLRCFDWSVPNEWNIQKAHIKRTNGDTLIDFSKNNLHVLGYSIPVNKRVSLSDLKKHLYYLKEKPDATPFATSYYKKRWGFCLPYSKYCEMEDNEYDVLIDSTLEPGSISLGECFIKGRTDKEILLFSHIGHPSMANDQLSGPLTIAAITTWLLDNQSDLNYSYRILLAPETIGSIAYIHENMENLKKKCVGGYTVVCTADDNSFTYRNSKKGNSLTDSAMAVALKHCKEDFQTKDFSPLGCDERHFNSHGIGIPIGSIMRSEPGSYPEYHTSLDNKEYISFDRLEQSAQLVINALRNLEADAIATAVHLNCEPKLDKYGLYPTLSNKNKNNTYVQQLISVWAYASGVSLTEISQKIDLPVYETRKLADTLAAHDIIRIEAI